jgi:2-dehydro-3-deoxygluconokinase
MKPLKIACIGEAMIELSLDESGRQAGIGFAGDALNTAIYLKRCLSPDHQVYFNSRLGQDNFSSVMIEYIEAENIDCSFVSKHESRSPGIYAISKDHTGDRVFSYWRENSAARTLFSTEQGDADFTSLEGMDVVYLSAITFAILPVNIVMSLLDWIEESRKKGVRFAFDSNYRPHLWSDKKIAQQVVTRAWKLCDIGLPSIDDEMALFADDCEAAALERLSSYAAPLMAVKRGASGPLAILNGQQQSSEAVFNKATKIVDTTSAGDSFNGAFLAAILERKSIDEALLAGHNIALNVIAHQGAIIPK